MCSSSSEVSALESIVRELGRLSKMQEMETLAASPLIDASSDSILIEELLKKMHEKKARVR